MFRLKLLMRFKQILFKSRNIKESENVNRAQKDKYEHLRADFQQFYWSAKIYYSKAISKDENLKKFVM